MLEEVKHGDSNHERKAGAFELVLNSTACSQWLMVGADAELAREPEGCLKEKREQHHGCDKNALHTSGLKNKIKPSNLTKKKKPSPSDCQSFSLKAEGWRCLKACAACRESGRSSACPQSVLEVTTPGLQHRAGNDDCTLSTPLGDTSSFIAILRVLPSLRLLFNHFR